MRLALGVPTEEEASADPAAFRAWAQEWQRCTMPGRQERGTRRWVRLGEQTLPLAWVLDGPEQVAHWSGQEERWARACRRLVLWKEWRDSRSVVALSSESGQGAREGGSGSSRSNEGLTLPGRFFDVFADYDDADFERLLTTLGWLLANPASGLYLRQLPLEGVDTKWVEKRAGVIQTMLAGLRGGREIEGAQGPDAADLVDLGNSATGLDARESGKAFYQITGLRPLPHRVRMRLLCPALRAAVGGLRDIEAPLDDLLPLSLAPKAVLVVENLQSGIALPDIPGVVSFIGLGRAVGLLRELRWLGGLPAWYWGDIDTHGLEILARAREALPGLRSILMEEGTLHQYRHLTVQEAQQHGGAGLGPLTAAERALFEGLKDGRWGARLRLEQERIPWDRVRGEMEGIEVALRAQQERR